MPRHEDPKTSNIRGTRDNEAPATTDTKRANVRGTDRDAPSDDPGFVARVRKDETPRQR